MVMAQTRRTWTDDEVQKLLIMGGNARHLKSLPRLAGQYLPSTRRHPYWVSLCGWIAGQATANKMTA
jgi:hypothetical protein